MHAPNKVRTDQKQRLIVQSSLPPYTMECWSCGKAFQPTPAMSGPHKGKHTDSSLDRAAAQHWRTCRG